MEFSALFKLLTNSMLSQFRVWIGYVDDDAVMRAQYRNESIKDFQNA